MGLGEIIIVVMGRQRVGVGEILIVVMGRQWVGVSGRVRFSS